MRLLLLAALAAGCADGGAHADARAFAEVLSAEPPLPFEEAGARCATLRAPEVRGDCWLLAASRDPAPDRCDAIPDERWRWECHFLAAEEATRSGDGATAAASCARAGDFRAECLEHAWSGPLLRLVRQGRDDPPELLQARAEELLVRVSPALEGGEERYWDRYHKSLAHHAPVVSARRCEVAPPERRELCAEATRRELERRLLALARRGPEARAICEAAAAGAPSADLPRVGWEPSPLLDDLGRGLLDRVCRGEVEPGPGPRRGG